MDTYFFDESEHGLGRVFVPSGPWQTGYKDLLETEKVAVVRLSSAAGWRGVNLEFLRELPELRGIEIYSQELRDVSVIASLPNLRLVGLECDLRTPIDFAGLSELQVVKATWKNAIESVLQCSTLNHLNVVNWPYADLEPLAQMSDLVKLQLTSRKLDSLCGIGLLGALEWLDLHACPRLDSIDDIRDSPNLWHVEATSCKSVHDVSAIGDLELLRELHLDNGGDIETLTPLQRCRQLEKLSFFGTTRIVDGKISAIQELPNLKTLRFAPRRHYDRGRDEVLSLS